MQRDFLISITGRQFNGQESDSIELTTMGAFFKRAGKHYISYREEDTENDSHVLTTLRVDGENQVTLIRSGSLHSKIILEKNKRHLCHYETVAGDMMIGVFTTAIRSQLTEKGGRLSFQYALDVNSEFVSDNDIEITIKEAQNKDV